MTEPEALRQTRRTFVWSASKQVSYFSGCDYYRMSSDPRTIAAAQRVALSEGLTVAASRLTTGNHQLFLDLETALRNFFNAKDALLVTAGYFGNLVVAQALAGQFSRAFIDEKSHPALADAALFLDCPVIPFQHRNVQSLRARLRRSARNQRVIVLTDGLFSHNGTTAPLGEYLKVLPRNALVLVDDAHGAGVVGVSGRGTLEEAGVGRERIIQTGTLSKAFGAGGGFILGTRELRQQILDGSRMFVGSTPVPLPMAAAALAAIRILSRGAGFRKHLRANAERVRRSLAGTAWDAESGPGPIVPILPRTPDEARDLNQRLRKARILPPFIRYPGGPANGYFRFVISSEHTPTQIAALENVLQGFAGRWK